MMNDDLQSLVDKWVGADNSDKNREVIISQIVDFIDKHKLVSIAISTNGAVCDNATIDYSVSYDGLNIKP
jgi:F420-0:gamma-glutamyl ligase